MWIFNNNNNINFWKYFLYHSQQGCATPVFTFWQKKLVLSLRLLLILRCNCIFYSYALRWHHLWCIWESIFFGLKMYYRKWKNGGVIHNFYLVQRSPQNFCIGIWLARQNLSFGVIVVAQIRQIYCTTIWCNSHF